MGYHTYYTLDFPDLNRSPHNQEELDSILELIRYHIGFKLSLDGDECAKWYDHDDHMLGISTSYPNILFRLYGEGDEKEDLWFTYYLNGKMQHCPAEFTFPKFDETKLT